MNIAFLGLSGAPYLRRAGDIRIMSFLKSMISKGNSGVIYNKYPVRKKTDRKLDFSLTDGLEIIEVFDIDPPKNKFLKFLLYLALYPCLFFIVIKWNRKLKIDILYTYTGHFFELFIYYILSRIINAKIVYPYEEFRSVIKRNGIYHKINGYLIDKYGAIFFDGAICISNFLQNHVTSKAPNIHTIKIPPICDFDLFDAVETNKTDDDYILFCGSAGYFDLIKLIVDSYSASKCSTYNVKLLLVIAGTQKEIEDLKHRFILNSDIVIVNNLTYFDLIKYYKTAKALLIPIRNTIQDIARFPNKICEYTASKAVIITVNNGEIPYFFKNEFNAIIAADYSVKSFADKIDWMLDNESCLPFLKENAYKLGKQHFNVKTYADELDDFLHHISAKMKR